MGEGRTAMVSNHTHNGEFNMKPATYFFAVGLALLCIGCPTRSLFPLFTEKDLVFPPEIIGSWTNGKGEIYSFQKMGDKGYEVEWRDEKGNTGTYKIQIGKLGKSLFLDSYPGNKDIDHHLLSTHIISKVSIDGDVFRLASLESDWLKKMIDGDKLTIAHVKLHDDIILTATTEELQQLVLRYADDDGAFPKPAELTRMK